MFYLKSPYFLLLLAHIIFLGAPQSLKAAVPSTLTLTGTAQSTTSISWSWASPTFSCTLAGTTVYYLIDTAASAVSTKAAVPHPTFSVTENFSDSPNQLYVRGVKTIDPCGASALSASVTTYSLAADPSNISTSLHLSTSSMILSWDVNGNPAYTRYEISHSTVGFTVSLSTPVAVSDNHTASSKTLTGLSPGTTYYFRLRAYNGRASDSSGAAFGSFVSTSIVTLPAAPTLSVVSLSTGSVRWSWTLTTGATGYRLYTVGGSTLIIDTPLLTYSSASLSADVSYGAEIEAYNSAGRAGPRSSASVYTKAARPQNPTISTVTANSVSLTWGLNGNHANTFHEVTAALDNAFTQIYSTTSALGSMAAVSGLFPGTTYYFRLKAINGDQVASAFATPVRSTITLTNSSINLSSAPLSPYTGVASDVVGLWHFDAASGTQAVDGSIQSNSGALVCLAAGCSSTPTFTASGPSYLNNAAAFTGEADSLVRVSSIAAYDFTDALTAGAWVKPATTALPDGTAIVAKGTGTYESFSLDIFGGKYRFLVSSPTVSVIATSTIRTSGWDHVVGVYDPAGPSLAIYVNGALSSSATAGVPAARIVNVSDISIGSRKSSSGTYDLGFNGSIDEVKLVNRALGAAEVLSEYRGAFPSHVSAAAGRSIQVQIAPNSFGAAVQIYISTDPLNNPVGAGNNFFSAGLANLPTTHVRIPDSFFEVVPMSGVTQFTSALGSSATISMSYADDDNDGFVDGLTPTVRATSLTFYTLDTGVLRWNALSTTVDGSAKRVSALTPHFSIFGLLGVGTISRSLPEVLIYPSPWKILSGGKFDASVLTFDRLPSDGTIRIFTLAGEKIIELPFTSADSGRVTWDGANAFGKKVASGVYFAYIKGGPTDGTKVFKFAIQK